MQFIKLYKTAALNTLPAYMSTKVARIEKLEFNLQLMKVFNIYYKHKCIYKNDFK